MLTWSPVAHAVKAVRFTVQDQCGATPLLIPEFAPAAYCNCLQPTVVAGPGALESHLGPRVSTYPNIRSTWKLCSSYAFAGSSQLQLLCTGRDWALTPAIMANIPSPTSLVSLLRQLLCSAQSILASVEFPVDQAEISTENWYVEFPLKRTTCSP